MRSNSGTSATCRGGAAGRGLASKTYRYPHPSSSNHTSLEPGRTAMPCDSGRSPWGSPENASACDDRSAGVGWLTSYSTLPRSTSPTPKPASFVRQAKKYVSERSTEHGRIGEENGPIFFPPRCVAGSAGYIVPVLRPAQHI